MAEVGFITQEQRERALRTPLKIQTREGAHFSKAPYFTEFIRRQMEKKYGKEILVEAKDTLGDGGTPGSQEEYR